MTARDPGSSFESPFGDLDFKQGDAARSVTSPAAYLTDLVQLLHDYFDFGEQVEGEGGEFDLQFRRPDIKDVLLNDENTFDLVPYLDIVNDLLRRKIEAQNDGQDGLELLKTAPYPFQLPVNYDFERLKVFLRFLRVDINALERLFGGTLDLPHRAALALGLSPEERDYLTTDRAQDEPAVKAAFHLAPTDPLTPSQADGDGEAALTNVSRFLLTTGLDGPKLRELLAQNLSHAALAEDGRPETTMAGHFFINHGLGGYATLDDDESHIIWRVDPPADESETGSDVPVAWFDRVDRFVRLAQKIGLSFTELDLVLRGCCQNRLDLETLQTLAVVSRLRERHELDVDVTCALLGDVNTLGMGDEDEPQDLFNRTFNGRRALLEQAYIPETPFVHAAYTRSSHRTIAAGGDLLAPENAAVRRRVQHALSLTEKDLTLILEKFRQHAPGNPSLPLATSRPLDLPGFSLLFRVATLVEMLDISVESLFDLLDLIAMDPMIRSADPFSLLLPLVGQQQDGYRLLSRPFDHPGDTLWLVQLLDAMVPWMEQADLSTAVLKYVQTGRTSREASDSERHARMRALFQQALDAFAAYALQQSALVSERFDSRSARVIVEALTRYEPAVVSPVDTRILTVNEETARAAAGNALTSLGVMSPADFEGLGLVDPTADKLLAHLVIYDYLTPEGELNIARLEGSQAEDEAALFHDFSDLRDDLFALIHSQYFEELNERLSTHGDHAVDPDDLDLSLFPSDLEGLELTEPQSRELHDNLVFNRLIDEQGRLLDPTFFADENNRDHLRVNTFLTGDHGKQLLEFLRDSIKAYQGGSHVLRRSILERLGLPDNEVRELIENLVFNDHIDEKGLYLDRETLVDLPPSAFRLALQFYPIHEDILAILQADLREDRARYLAIRRETLTELADALVAHHCFEVLHNGYLARGRIDDGRQSFFKSVEGREELDLGPTFSAEERGVVFSRIQDIQTRENRYRLDPERLAGLDLEADELDDLMWALVYAGYVDAQRFIAPESLSYFLKVDNAAAFHIDGYDDFDKDVFFACHAVARETRTSRDEIALTLLNLARAQENSVLASLAEGLEVDPGALRVICRNFLYHPDHLAEALLEPILQTSERTDRPPRPHLSRLFSRVAQFISLAQALKLGPEETELFFQDQNLVEKFPENLVLPDGVHHFDALLEGLDGKIYLFRDSSYWAYSAASYELIESARSLAALSPLFAAIDRVDAAFIDPLGQAWLFAGTSHFVRPPHSDSWQTADRQWGLVKNNIAQGEPVHAAFATREGIAYLFAGSQYVRYSTAGFERVDAGFPRQIDDGFARELQYSVLPDQFGEGIDAAFEDSSGQTILFKGDQFVRLDRGLPAESRSVVPYWGRVNNVFTEFSRVDAATTLDGRLYLFLDDQLTRISDAVENDGVFMDEGFPRRLSSWLPDLPDEFEYGVDAVFKGEDGQIHLFKNSQTARYTADRQTLVGEGALEASWGRIRNHIQSNGTIDATLTGLDGCTYVFSGDQFFRYSGADYTRVDEGYPKSIAPVWGGLQEVAAAFILDGKTYLFAKNQGTCIRYSTNDYATPDDGYPQVLDQQQFWNLPQQLVAADFSEPDAIFDAQNGDVFLFKGQQFVCFDHLHRWWTEPAPISSKWKSAEFDRVDAAFTGKDGRTYLFSGRQYVRYSDPDFNAFDDRYPRETASFWGQVVNQIERTGRVDSAVVVESRITEADASGQPQSSNVRHTYLFSGSQFYRYVADQYEFVEEGYPRTIQGSLHLEPRFSNLNAPLHGRIDAAFADQRHVYLVQDGNILIVADEAVHRYTNHPAAPAVAALIDEGTVFTATAKGWQRHVHLEAAGPPPAEPQLPPMLRDVPGSFQSGLDAVLQGTDSNTYLFKGEDCYNYSLDKRYSIREEWGRVRNLITLESHVDAAFVGLDGRTYLFCDDQFVSYKSGEVADVPLQDRFIDGLPRPIADYWGGLGNVHLAFVRDRQTFLMERPDENGVFRYVRYSSADYSEPDEGFPQTADFSWWEIPDVYQEEGFERVDAVLNDDRNLFLIQGQSFIQYNIPDALWTYPKPVNRVWRGLDFDHPDFRGITTAFRIGDGRVAFFSEDHFAVVEHDVDRPAGEPTGGPIFKIRDHWGRVRNSLTLPGTIDASIVLDGYTYLFAGPQYVRYSTSDYRFVDEGYPRSIADHLAQEKPFAHLAEEFVDEMRRRGPAGQGIDAAAASRGAAYFFVDESVYAVSRGTRRTQELSRLGRVKNRIQQREKVDAALAFDRDGQHQLLLFSGDQLFRYSDSSYEFVDERYPQQISTWLSTIGESPTVPAFFTYDLDAVVRSGESPEAIYLFKEALFLSSQQPQEPQPIVARWGRLANNFAPTEDGGNVALDAAFVTPDGRTYLFKGNQFMRYSGFEQAHADEGFPRPIKGHWGHLPDHFETAVDGGFVFEGKTYLLHDGNRGDQAEYVRYSRQNYRAVDNIYPQKTTHRWRGWGDFLLADIRIMSAIKRLQGESSDDSGELTALLNAAAVDEETPYEVLRKLFGWSVAESKWLKRHHTFLPAADRFEKRFNLELLEKMAYVFDVCGRLGADPSAVHAGIWQNLFAGNRPADTKAAAEHLLRYLSTQHSAKDWATIEREIHDELNLLQRDVFVPLAIAGDPLLQRPSDLYESLLIDVEMGSAARTSRVKEAISAIQLYFHRYLVQLEDITLSPKAQELGRDTLKERWRWLKNYRLWEANRKVFLYPENYIRPELRDTKTPEFRKLEEMLLQGELNAETAEAAFSNYLESFGQVSALKVVGANVYTEGDEKVVILVGHTRLAPRQFFFRTARFTPHPDRSKHDLVVWSSWEPIDTTIKADRVFPTRSHGRLVVFWIEIEDIEEPAAKFKLKADSRNQETISEFNTTRQKLRHEATINYSLLQYNKHWSPPQELKRGIRLNYEVDAAYAEGDEVVTFAGRYCLRSSEKNPHASVRRIEEVEEFRNLPPSFKSGVQAATLFNGKRYLFKGNECIVQETGASGAVVAHKTLRDLIDSPLQAPLYVIAPGIYHVGAVERDETQDNPVLRNGIDAAFDFGKGILALVDAKGNYSFYQETNDPKAGLHLKPIQDSNSLNAIFPGFFFFIFTLVNRSGNFRQADAVFSKESVFYVLRDGQYEVYDDVGTELVPLDGYPKPIRGNLSINIDKFYNKLHIEERNQELYVSYNTPQNEILVYGRLKPDYTFEDIPIDTVPAIRMVRSWPSFIRTHLSPYPGQESERTVEHHVQSFSKDLDDVKKAIDQVQAVRSVKNDFRRVLNRAQKLQEAARGNLEAESAEGEGADLAPLQQDLRDMAAAINSTLTPLANEQAVRQSVIGLTNALASLIRTTSRAGRGSAERQQRTIDDIGREVDGGNNLLDEVERRMAPRVVEIKALVSRQTESIDRFADHGGKRDVQAHSGNIQSIDSFLTRLLSYVTEWRRRLGSNEMQEREEITSTREILLDPYRAANDAVGNSLQRIKEQTNKVRGERRIAGIESELIQLKTRLEEYSKQVTERAGRLNKINANRLADARQSPLGHRELVSEVGPLARAAEEKILGAFEVFPSSFGIQTTADFAFSEPDHADWYCFEAQGGTFLARPAEKAGNTYEIIRLTTSLVPTLSGILFAQGISGFLSPATQRTDEIPAFGSGEGEVNYKQGPFTRPPGEIPTQLIVPETLNLDLRGASGIYYEELFFHAPFLIAQALNDAQKFEEAKTWYEYIFDPTAEGAAWQYLPFTEKTQDGNFLIDQGQIRRYLDDPFDPHAIAALRPTAYCKAVVMRYIDNLLDWGDMLYRQYTHESINEARMLYVLGRDLLGERPENLGTLVLSEGKPVIALANTDEYDFVIHPARASSNGLIGSEPITIIEGTPHDSIGTRYFFVPENELFFGYWGRVEDRLYKIRHSLNIDGVAQPLPLFQPPIDPMALVQAVARGVSLSQLVGGAAVAVPHYRFEFLMFRAQNLVGKLNQYSGELLATLEKKDAEALSLLQSKQEGRILKMMINIREAQIKEAETAILNLQESRDHARERINLYQGWLDSGLLPEEIHQVNLMIAASVAHFTGSLLKLGSMIASLAPDAKIGPFIMGIETGGSNIGDSLSSGAEIAENLGEGLSVTGEVLGTQAQLKHMIEDWETQLMIAESEDRQIAHQLEGARLQKTIAEYELATLQKEIEQNKSIVTFMKDKFTNEALYRWMIGRMSGLYYQTYQMAFDMARMAEKAYQFERGTPEREVSFITGGYWDSQRQGLLAGEALALDIDRMEQAFIESNERRLEIAKETSLLELDPLAFLRLKRQGSCEFRLDEAFYDYDFPGHYGRQIKTVAVKFDVPEGVTINATLTQLGDQTVLQADAKAVKYLLEPRDMPPSSIRGSWRGGQQIILSHHDQYEKNNGMFELRYDTDRYLPFEGTGAVSHWRLDLNGKAGAVDLRELVDVTIQVQYTARNGGAAFVDEVKGLLKPVQAVRFFDMTYDFAQEWQEFLDGDAEELVLPFTRGLFPNMSGSKISGIFTHLDLAEAGRMSLVLNGVEAWTLNDNSYQETNGLSISPSGSELRFAVRGQKQNLRNMQFVFGYRASVR